MIFAMQKKAQSAVVALLMVSLLAAPLAEAKRVGGGKSMGMKRSQSSSQNYSQNSYNNHAAPTPAQAQPQRSGSNIGGMVAAGVAGAALGAVAGNAMADHNNNQPVAQNQASAQQEKKSGFSWLWLIVLAAAGFFIFRRFSAKKQAAGANPYAPNHGATAHNSAPASPFSQAPSVGANSNIFGQPVAQQSQATPAANFGAYTQSGNQLPDGSEPASFLRFARQRFNHIQAMNNPSNIAEIQKYFSAEMYQSIYADVANNADVAEFSNLTATIVDQATEAGQYVVSVRFNGTVSEDLNSLPQPFSEVWHFVKPIASSEDWLVAGIQQGQ
jgi:predicted lipid-binding transport protein (Tim44 family)